MRQTHPARFRIPQVGSKFPRFSAAGRLHPAEWRQRLGKQRVHRADFRAGVPRFPAQRVLATADSVPLADRLSVSARDLSRIPPARQAGIERRGCGFCGKSLFVSVVNIDT